jgi:glycyl-tRNA synthetase beta subunit
VAAASQALKESGESSLSAALVPYRRARNLTQDITSKDAAPHSVKPDLFKEDAEQQLLLALTELEKKCGEWLSAGRFSDYFRGLAALGAPLAVFFEKVLVNAEDPAIKANRIALLFKVRGLYEQAADFSKVQV